MATAPPQPGSIDFLQYFVQQGTVGGQVSVLKGTLTGTVTESDIENAQRVPIMFRCLLPQINEYRHAILLMRREIHLLQRDHAVIVAFSISNRINGTHGMISRIRPIWATGHAPAPADVNTFKKTLEVMGSRMNGFMEVEAVQLRCRHCPQTDPHRMLMLADPTTGYSYLCGPCANAYYEVAT